MSGREGVDPMLRTLIIGLGQAGWTLHLPVLTRLRDSAYGEGLFSAEPIVVYDPDRLPTGRRDGSIAPKRSLKEAREVLDPARTVVHVCTPPSARIEVLRQVAELGFRKVLVEKPLSADRAGIARILEVRDAWDLNLSVVSHWLDSTLTRRLTKLVYSGRLGELRSIEATQRKPRFSRSLDTNGHPSAFDVEVPHSLAVALRLAGEATVVDASWSDMEVNGHLIPRMGAARLVLRHDHGVRTEIFSELTSLLRERRITLEFERGRVTGYYPVSRDDDHALMTVETDGREETEIFRDDSLASFLMRTYRGYAAGHRITSDLELNVEIVSLLSDAKHLCEAGGRETAGAPGTAPSSGTVKHVR
ncbi:Gfo/Idh/MocA family oxidoreductase [Actinomadura viridis]|uniref:Gfo/Idh/MocA family oxidoreductase n=1 Tax=Actinomadura viridis TaxID=58110 RepID=UPI00367C05EA